MIRWAALLLLAGCAPTTVVYVIEPPETHALPASADLSREPCLTFDVEQYVWKPCKGSNL